MGNFLSGVGDVASGLTIGEGSEHLQPSEKVLRVLTTLIAGQSPQGFMAAHQLYNEENQNFLKLIGSPEFQNMTPEARQQYVPSGWNVPGTLPPPSPGAQTKFLKDSAELYDAEEAEKAIKADTEAGRDPRGAQARLRRALGAKVSTLLAGPEQADAIESSRSVPGVAPAGVTWNAKTGASVTSQIEPEELPTLPKPVDPTAGSPQESAPITEQDIEAERQTDQPVRGLVSVKDKNGAVANYMNVEKPDGTIVKQKMLPDDVVKASRESAKREHENNKAAMVLVHKAEGSANQLNAVYGVFDKMVTPAAFPLKSAKDSTEMVAYRYSQWKRSSVLPVWGGKGVEENRPLNEFLDFKQGGVRVAALALGEVRPTDADVIQIAKTLPEYDDPFDVAQSKLATSKWMFWDATRRAYELAGQPFDIPEPTAATGPMSSHKAEPTGADTAMAKVKAAHPEWFKPKRSK